MERAPLITETLNLLTTVGSSSSWLTQIPIIAIKHFPPPTEIMDDS